ncbi:hypothetical protein DPMN_115643 [Dreissena polymorpha]|uniref:B box-type domain-containing protein n=1 Tax=Dreissena polymorpha TaxID=45954 RepID=A0A9D4KME5_DREPO|nr:hypothetical protein DPMN_115643 [Dreissena polymorpha]
MCDQSDCHSEKTCDPCSLEGKKETAKHFCVHCLEYFCINCAQYHRKYKPSRAHTVLNDLPEDKRIYERVLKFSHCPSHPEIEIDRFCKHHDEMFCRLCSDIHASCENVVNIEECKKGNIDAIPDKLTALKSMYLTQKKELERQLEELRVNSLEVKNNIMEYAQQIREVADKVERSLNESHQSLISPVYAVIKQGIEKVEEKEAQLNECKIFHDIMPNTCSTKDQYVLVCKLYQLMNDSVIQKSGKDGFSVFVRLISPLHTKELVAELLKCEVKLLSNEELTQEKFSDEDTSSAAYNAPLTAEDKKKEKQGDNDVLECDIAAFKPVEDQSGPSQIKEPVKDIDNQLDFDDNYPFLTMILGNKKKIFDIRKTDVARKGLCNIVCNIVTLDVLSDGRILLIDDCKNVLQLFTNEFVLISCMVLARHKPVDMCVVEDKEDKTFTVAICFEGRNYIRLIEHVLDFNIKKNMQCKGTILSLTLFSLDILVLTYEKNTKYKDHQIQVIQSTSRRVPFVLNVPRLMVSKEGHDIFMHDLSIIRASNIARRIILAADDEVYVFSIPEGKLEEQWFTKPLQCDWFYHRSENTCVSSITDVKMDIQGNIYICDHDSGVHQVSAKSRRDSRILFPKSERMSAIVIDMPRRRILVCHANTSLTSMYRIW